MIASRSLPAAELWQRSYRASATITLLSVPVFTRNGVGNGFAHIGETPGPDGKTISITFGAGSWPEDARGLNRLGFIREVVTEKRSGQPAECSYFAFMTSSKEESLDEARGALNASGPEVPYAIAEASGARGTFSSRVEHVMFPSQLTWRDYPALIEKARAAIASEAPVQRVDRRLANGQQAPSTFLYAVRNAMLAPGPRTKEALIYNGCEYLLSSEKQTDADGSIRINATIRNMATGRATPFKVWYEAGSEHLPPVRFEYQAKPYLRLTFDWLPDNEENS